MRAAAFEWLERRQLLSGGPADPEAASGPAAGPGGLGPPVAVNNNFIVERGSNHWYSRVEYNGHNYIDDRRAWTTHPWLRLFVTNLDGSNPQEVAWQNPISQTWNAATQTLVRTYPVGKVTYQYVQGENSIGWRVTVENNTTDRIITGYNLLITDVRFTNPQIQYPGERSVSGSAGGLQAIRVNDGPNAVFLVNESPGKQQVMNFQQYAGSEQQGSYRIRVGTARLWGDGATYPTTAPVIPLAPGESDFFALSLRFTSSALTSEQAIPDVFAKARQQRPFIVNWLDRRPIGAFWAHGGNHPLASINTSTPAGFAQYQQRALLTAHQLAQAAINEGLQGIIFWDLEGTDQFNPAHNYAYVGDPRAIPLLNPAFDSVADQFFAILRNAGLRIGMTIRNSDLVPSGNAYTHVTPADPVASYLSKVAYARERWGAELFYVDVADLYDLSALEEVHRQYPDVLLMPELKHNKGTGYHAFTAPFIDQRMSGWNTPDHIRELYPDAFSVVWVGDTQGRSNPTNSQILRTAVQRGDILLAHVGNMMDISQIAESAGVPLIRPAPPPPPPPSLPPTPPTPPSVPSDPEDPPTSNPPPANPTTPGTPQNNGSNDPGNYLPPTTPSTPGDGSSSPNGNASGTSNPTGNYGGNASTGGNSGDAGLNGPGTTTGSGTVGSSGGNGSTSTSTGTGYGNATSSTGGTSGFGSATSGNPSTPFVGPEFPPPPPPPPPIPSNPTPPGYTSPPSYPPPTSPSTPPPPAANNANPPTTPTPPPAPPASPPTPPPAPPPPLNGSTTPGDASASSSSAGQTPPVGASGAGTGWGDALLVLPPTPNASTTDAATGSGNAATPPSSTAGPGSSSASNQAPATGSGDGENDFGNWLIVPSTAPQDTPQGPPGLPTPPDGPSPDSTSPANTAPVSAPDTGTTSPAVPPAVGTPTGRPGTPAGAHSGPNAGARWVGRAGGPQWMARQFVRSAERPGVGAAPAQPQTMQLPAQPTRVPAAGPAANPASGVSAGSGLSAGLPRSLLTVWRVGPSDAPSASGGASSVHQMPATMSPVRATTPVPFVAPLITGTVRVNPLLVSSSPQLFSSQGLAGESHDDLASGQAA
ncbi:MAG: hypothetical protein ACK4PI_00625 [Tepidisphaerales bacterium]